MNRRVDRCLCLDDFERQAARILPNSLYRFIAGGAEDGRSVEANRHAFDDWTLVPRVLVDCAARDTTTTLFGHAWAAPFGIAPMGAMGVAAYRADLVLARAAARANLPFVLSTSALVSMERVLHANAHAWFQLYASPVEAENDAIIERARRAGFRTLVVTVDVPVAGNREEDLRNGYASPLRPSWRLVAGAITHPEWLFGCLLRTLAREGLPHFENLPTARVPMIARTAPRPHRRDHLRWDDVRRLRDRWPGTLVLKGVLATDDVRAAVGIGVDGVIVSNHGGRQLDGAIAPLHALVALRDAAGPMPLLIDSGIRRGTDLLKAIGLGASLGFVGRPMLYAAVAGGDAGVTRALALLHAEVHRDLALLGCRSPAQARERVVPQPSGYRPVRSNP